MGLKWRPSVFLSLPFFGDCLCGSGEGQEPPPTASRTWRTGLNGRPRAQTPSDKNERRRSSAEGSFTIPRFIPDASPVSSSRANLSERVLCSSVCVFLSSLSYGSVCMTSMNPKNERSLSHSALCEKESRRSGVWVKKGSQVPVYAYSNVSGYFYPSLSLSVNPLFLSVYLSFFVVETLRFWQLLSRFIYLFCNTYYCALALSYLSFSISVFSILSHFILMNEFSFVYTFCVSHK